MCSFDYLFAVQFIFEKVVPDFWKKYQLRGKKIPDFEPNCPIIPYSSYAVNCTELVPTALHLSLQRTDSYAFAFTAAYRNVSWKIIVSAGSQPCVSPDPILVVRRPPLLVGLRQILVGGATESFRMSAHDVESENRNDGDGAEVDGPAEVRGPVGIRVVYRRFIHQPNHPHEDEEEWAQVAPGDSPVTVGPTPDHHLHVLYEVLHTVQIAENEAHCDAEDVRVDARAVGVVQVKKLHPAAAANHRQT